MVSDGDICLHTVHFVSAQKCGIRRNSFVVFFRDLPLCKGNGALAGL